MECARWGGCARAPSVDGEMPYSPLQGIRSQDQRLQLSQSFKHRLDTMQAAQSRGMASNTTLNSMPSMA